MLEVIQTTVMPGRLPMVEVLLQMEWSTVNPSTIKVVDKK